MRDKEPIKKHPTGVYITDVPYDHVNDMCNLNYKEADERGFFKLDLLNVNIYKAVQDEMHLISLMAEPNWERLKERNFVSVLLHLNKQFDIMQKMPEPIDSIHKTSNVLGCYSSSKEKSYWADMERDK